MQKETKEGVVTKTPSKFFSSSIFIFAKETEEQKRRRQLVKYQLS